MTVSSNRRMSGVEVLEVKCSFTVASSRRTPHAAPPGLIDIIRRYTPKLLSDRFAFYD